MSTLSPQIIAIITTIGALVVPPVTSLLKRENWPTPLKQLVAGVLSLGIAAAAIAIVAPADFALPLLTLGGLIYAGSQVIYGAYFANSTVETVLRAVGSKKSAPAATPS